MSIYYIIYKTTHVNGKYYIGMHQTKNLNDGYLGSGKWVNDVKDKSLLSREIIAETNSFDSLTKLEEYYIDLHWDDPLCMNMKKGSYGWTSEDATRINNDRVKEGTNPFQKRPDGSSITSDKVRNGTHQFQTRLDGTSVSSNKVRNGTHHFLTRPDGTSISSDRVNNGTHQWLKQKGTVPCYNKQGEYVRIPKNQYDSQYGPMEDREWVFNCSKEGKRRKLLRE